MRITEAMKVIESVVSSPALGRHPLGPKSAV